MALRFEFDPVLKILLIRVDGLFTDEALREYYRASRKYSTATDAHAVITDFSAVTEFAASGEMVRHLASQEPAIPHPERPRILVAPQTVAYGLSRMFQIAGESTRPTLSVVHTMDEAIAALGIQSPHFEPLA